MEVEHGQFICGKSSKKTRRLALNRVPSQVRWCLRLLVGPHGHVAQRASHGPHEDRLVL